MTSLCFFKDGTNIKNAPKKYQRIYDENYKNEIIEQLINEVCKITQTSK